MSTYKLVDSDQLDTDLTAVAESIRAKTGGSETLVFPDGFVTAINQLGASMEDVSTVAEMEALLIQDNIGKIYRYTGTTSETYINGDIYIVEESEAVS